MVRFSSIVLLLATLCSQLSCVHEPIYLEPADPLEENPDNGGETLPPVGDSGKFCDPDSVYFENQILPIFIGSCAVTGCHDLATKEADIALVNYANIMKGISPGNPGGSKYYKVITLTDPSDLMPVDPVTGEGFSLPADQIALIEQWINQNATNNSCEDCDTSVYNFSGPVATIFNTSCATSVGCHASGSPNGQFTSYETIKPFVDNGTIMDRAIVKMDMPVAASLPACDITILRKWLEEGGSNN